MSINTEFFDTNDFLDDDFERFDHLPLDWNEEIGLEEYLEKLDKARG